MTPRIRAGTPGTLNIIVNGETIFSKKAAKRSPTASELFAIIDAKAKKA